jgi:hypothetical protein
MILHNGEPAKFKTIQLGNRSKKPSRAAVERVRGPAYGPGSIFSKVIFKLTGQETKLCARCTTRMRQMNSLGWWGCWKNRATILEWLAEEARRRGHAISETQLSGLFRAAIKEAFGKRERAFDSQ